MLKIIFGWNFVVIIFSNRKNKLLDEIIEILTVCGADFLCDKSVNYADGYFTVAIFYKPINIKIKKGIVLILDDIQKFENQILPDNLIGICDNTNYKSIKIFEKNKISVVTCGNNNKNTITISSINQNNLVITLQRILETVNGKLLQPADYKITVKKQYSSTAILISTAILLINDIEPKEF